MLPQASSPNTLPVEVCEAESSPCSQRGNAPSYRAQLGGVAHGLEPSAEEFEPSPAVPSVDGPPLQPRMASWEVPGTVRGTSGKNGFSSSRKHTSYCHGKIERSGTLRLLSSSCSHRPKFLLHIHASWVTEYGVSNGLFDLFLRGSLKESFQSCKMDLWPESLEHSSAASINPQKQTSKSKSLALALEGSLCV